MEHDPIPETWYRDLESDELFCVTSVVPMQEVVEIQYFDGDVAEMELREWVQRDLEIAEAPEDWSGVHDRIDREDLDDGESVARNPAGDTNSDTKIVEP